MKQRLGLFFMVCLLIGVVVAADMLGTHLLLPQERLAGVTQEVYRLLIAKWFCTGIVLGMTIMFFLVEAWVWKNWKSWNKFCCDHHERVYRAQMGISQGPMLRR